MKKEYMMIAYKLENGYKRDITILESKYSKEYLEYLLNFAKAQEYIAKGYIVKVFESI